MANAKNTRKINSNYLTTNVPETLKPRAFKRPFNNSVEDDEDDDGMSDTTDSDAEVSNNMI